MHDKSRAAPSRCLLDSKSGDETMGARWLHSGIPGEKKGAAGIVRDCRPQEVAFLTNMLA